jgi:hypothetical protein
MAEMKKRPDGIQDRNTGKQYSETGELRAGKAKGHPENVKDSLDQENNKQINPNESRTMGNPSQEKSRGSDESSNRNSRSSGSSL